MPNKNHERETRTHRKDGGVRRRKDGMQVRVKQTILQKHEMLNKFNNIYNERKNKKQ